MATVGRVYKAPVSNSVNGAGIGVIDTTIKRGWCVTMPVTVVVEQLIKLDGVSVHAGAFYGSRGSEQDLWLVVQEPHNIDLFDEKVAAVGGAAEKVGFVRSYSAYADNPRMYSAVFVYNLKMA